MSRQSLNYQRSRRGTTNKVVWNANVGQTARPVRRLTSHRPRGGREWKGVWCGGGMAGTLSSSLGTYQPERKTSPWEVRGAGPVGNRYVVVYGRWDRPTNRQQRGTGRWGRKCSPAGMGIEGSGPEGWGINCNENQKVAPSAPVVVQTSSSGTLTNQKCRSGHGWCQTVPGRQSSTERRVRLAVSWRGGGNAAKPSRSRHTGTRSVANWSAVFHRNGHLSKR